MHSRGKQIGKDVDFEKIARRTPGQSACHSCWQFHHVHNDLSKQKQRILSELSSVSTRLAHVVMLPGERSVLMAASAQHEQLPVLNLSLCTFSLDGREAGCTCLQSGLDTIYAVATTASRHSKLCFAQVVHPAHPQQRL